MCLSLFMTAIRYRQFTGTKITRSSHKEPLPNQVADPETEAANRPRVPVPLGRAYHLSNTCTWTHNPTTQTCKSTSVALQQGKTARRIHLHQHRTRWASGSRSTPTHVSFETTTVHTGNHRVEPQHSARGQSRLQLAHHPTHCRAPDLMYSLRVGRLTPSPRHGNGSGDGGSRTDVRPCRIKTAAILTESPQRGAHRRAARECMLHGRA